MLQSFLKANDHLIFFCSDTAQLFNSLFLFKQELVHFRVQLPCVLQRSNKVSSRGLEIFLEICFHYSIVGTNPRGLQVDFNRKNSTFFPFKVSELEIINFRLDTWE